VWRIGDFVELRGRPWPEGFDACSGLETLRLSCIADDSQSEPLEMLCDVEIGPASSIETSGRTSPPTVLIARATCA
jgi:hypothetical protein